MAETSSHSSYSSNALPLQTRQQKVVIIGTGYVGLPLSLYAAKHNFEVIGFDTDNHKVQALRSKKSDELSTAELQLLHTSTAYYTSNKQEIADADIYIICVPTPVDEQRLPVFGPLEAACLTVGEVMSKGSLVIVESTINPGVSEDLVIPLLEASSSLTVGNDFHYAFCPERVNPGDALYTTENIARVVGGYDEQSLQRAVDFYEEIITAKITPMQSLKEAEAVKMVENAFRDINIAFANEIAMAFDRVNINTKHVIDAAATKPFSFLAHYPGCGVGGHCIPVDPHYLIQYGKQHGFVHKFLIAAREINEAMPHYTVSILRDMLEADGVSMSGEKVALLGLAYKKGISDQRESPALVIKQDLQESGAIVTMYDPHVLNGSNASSLREALEGVTSVIIATDHDEFCQLTPEDLLQCGVKRLVDGRNCLKSDTFTESGIVYHGIGDGLKTRSR